MPSEEAQIPESEVNKMLGQQAEKHLRELDEKLRTRDIEHSLSDIKKSQIHMDAKVCAHMKKEDEREAKFMKAIEDSGAERRHCETTVHKRIDEIEEFNHETFVKKSALRNYAIIIITAVTLTTSFITWIGVINTNKANDVSVDKIAEAIIKKIGK